MSVDFAPGGPAIDAAGNGQLELCFGGVQLRFRGSPDLLEYVARGSRFRHCPTAPQPQTGDSRAFAELTCRLVRATFPTVAAAEAGAGNRALSCNWANDEARAVARDACAQITVQAGKYNAEGSIAPSRRAAQNLLTLLAYALVHHADGAVLHAASVELPDGVVAFVGPSGAGKSTACEHAVGARFFSADRLAAVPAEKGWSAHPLPGGTPLAKALPASDSLGRPLRAILRIRQVQEGCWFEPCPTGRAVALLRESTFHVGRGQEPELDLLSRLERLALALPVGNLYFSLGTPLGQLLRLWLRDGTLDGRPVSDSEPGPRDARHPTTKRRLCPTPSR